MARQGAQLPCREDLQLPHVGGERPAGSVEGDQLVEGSANGLGVLRIARGHLDGPGEARMGHYLLDDAVHLLVAHRLGEAAIVFGHNAFHGVEDGDADPVVSLVLNKHQFVRAFTPVLVPKLADEVRKPLEVRIPRPCPTGDEEEVPDVVKGLQFTAIAPYGGQHGLFEGIEVLQGQVDLQSAVFGRDEIRFQEGTVVVQFAVMGLLQPHLDDGEVLADGGDLAPLVGAEGLVPIHQGLVPILKPHRPTQLGRGESSQLQEDGAVFGDGPSVEFLPLGVGPVGLRFHDEGLHPFVKGQGGLHHLFLACLEAIQGAAELLPGRLPLQGVGERMKRVLDGLELLVDSLVEGHQSGPFISVQGGRHLEALTLPVPPLRGDRHTEALAPLRPIEMERRHGPTGGVGGSQEQDGDVHGRLGRA